MTLAAPEGPPVEVRLAGVDGASLRARHRAGIGPGLVLLHGLGQVSEIWDRFAAGLPQRAGFAVPDLRGHGGSDRDPTGRYELAMFAGDLSRVLEALAPAGAVVVGHSLGGRIVAELLAHGHPHLLGAVIVDIGPVAPAAGLAVLSERNRGRPALFGSIEEYCSYLAVLHPLATRDDLVRLAAAALRTAPGGYEERVDPAVLQRWSGGALHDAWPPRAAASCPVLLVRGVASAMLTRAAAADMVRSGLADEVIEVPRAGHGVVLDNCDGLLSAVDPFLGQLIGF